MKKKVSVLTTKKKLTSLRKDAGDMLAYKVPFLCRLDTAGNQVFWVCSNFQPQQSWFVRGKPSETQVTCCAPVQRAEARRCRAGRETHLLWKAAGVVSLQDITLDGGTNARAAFQVLRHDSYLKPPAILNSFSSPSLQKNLAPKMPSFSQENAGTTTCSLAENLEQELADISRVKSQSPSHGSFVVPFQ